MSELSFALGNTYRVFVITWEYGTLRLGITVYSVLHPRTGLSSQAARDRDKVFTDDEEPNQLPSRQNAEDGANSKKRTSGVRRRGQCDIPMVRSPIES